MSEKNTSAVLKDSLLKDKISASAVQEFIELNGVSNFCLLVDTLWGLMRFGIDLKEITVKELEDIMNNVPVGT